MLTSNSNKIFKNGECEDADDFHNKDIKSKKLQPVDGDERAAIELLIQATWDAQFVGAGKDGVNLSHKIIQVVNVERMENPELWERYCNGKKNLLLRLKKSSAVRPSFTPLENLTKSGPVRTTNSLPKGSLLRRDVTGRVNEHYLFHGFKIDLKNAILRDGLDFRVATDGAMLGRGIYAAESATKADQYADPKHKRSGGNKAMILMRVLLGEAYINTLPKPPKFSRPPCMSCKEDKCACPGSARYDCVIDDAGRNFREFVLYEHNLCYPEYFITYVRV